MQGKGSNKLLMKINWFELFGQQLGISILKFKIYLLLDPITTSGKLFKAYFASFCYPTEPESLRIRNSGRD